MNNRQDITLALSGIFQAAVLVKQLAWTGKLDQAPFEASIHSLFQINSEKVSDIYGGQQNLQVGLQALIDLLDNNAPNDREIAKYTISLLHLEKRLMKNPIMLQMIRQGIERAQTQAEHFSPTHENVMANLAGIYTDTLSTFKFRIHVTGEPNHLTNANTTNRVRALLLAGIRSAVLWRQLGGSRLQLVFGRKNLVSQAKQLLESLKESEPA